MKRVSPFLFLATAFAVAVICYRKPLQDDFDRFIYEALIRSDRQPIEEIYRVVKHEAPRAESSSVLDSPGHLAELEPLYAVRPLYLQAASLLEPLSGSPQSSLHLISAISLFLCAVLLGIATGQYLYSVLAILVPGILITGRMGTPDIFSGLMILASMIALMRDRLLVGLIFLLLAVWIRTDNVLFVVAVLAWLTFENKLPVIYTLVLAGLAAGSVEWINYFAGNYGWKVLVQYSFIGGRYPAAITPHITAGAYARVLIDNAQFLLPQLAPWLLLGIVSWRVRSPNRSFLLPIAAAVGLHYLLFPSAEARYFVWAFLLIALIFIRGIAARQEQTTGVSTGASINALQKNAA